MGAAEVIAGWFAQQPSLDVERLERGEGAWLSQLSGERKRTIPVYLELGAHNLAIQSFFMRAPDENEAEVYRFLLQRNLRTYVFRFALSHEGDVLILAVLPLPAVTPDELDRVMGQLLVVADEAFNPALRAGFTTYIEREQAWREKVGTGRNPIT
jgi:hypothetical protein